MTAKASGFLWQSKKFRARRGRRLRLQPARKQDKTCPVAASPSRPSLQNGRPRARRRFSHGNNADKPARGVAECALRPRRACGQEATCCAAASRSRPPPSILILLCGKYRRQRMGCRGLPAVEKPAICRIRWRQISRRWQFRSDAVCHCILRARPPPSPPRVHSSIAPRWPHALLRAVSACSAAVRAVAPALLLFRWSLFECRRCFCCHCYH